VTYGAAPIFVRCPTAPSSGPTVSTDAISGVSHPHPHPRRITLSQTISVAYGPPPSCPHGPKHLDTESMSKPQWVHSGGPDFLEEACYPTDAVPAAAPPVIDPLPVVLDATECEQSAPTGTKQRVIPRKPNDWIPAVINCPDVTGVTLLVALLMGQHADWDTGTSCFPSQARIAAAIGNKDTRGLRNHLEALREDGMGWLTRRGTVESGQYAGNQEYWLTIPECNHSHDGSALRRIVEQKPNPRKNFVATG
jgi:hypothetical protein